jgi:hypothetical protein
MVEQLLPDIEAALGRLGLFVVRPVDQPTLDRAGVALRLEDMLPGARAALVIGDGGGDFFAGFCARLLVDPDLQAAPDPLDAYTALVIPAAVRVAVGASLPLAFRYPFDDQCPALAMQAIGVAAGLPRPGPLGIQVHPRFGPWWAYRAFLVLPVALEPLPPLADSCSSCAAPCQRACLGQAVHPHGPDLLACARHRLVDDACRLSCEARRACIVGTEHAYTPRQLGFHMAASLTTVRRYLGG